MYLDTSESIDFSSMEFFQVSTTFNISKKVWFGNIQMADPWQLNKNRMKHPPLYVKRFFSLPNQAQMFIKNTIILTELLHDHILRLVLKVFCFGITF